MSYGTEWWQKSIAETKRFWNPKRISVAVLSPPLAGVFWTIFKPWDGWVPIVQVAIISILGFFALWGVVFFVSLIEAPSQLDSEKVAAHEGETATLRGLREKSEYALAEKTRENERLKEALAQKHSHNEHLESKVRLAMGALDEADVRFIRWLLDNGRVNRGKIQMAGFHGTQVEINNKTGIELITHEPERSANGTEIDRYHQVNPAILDALKNILHPPRPVTPPPE